MKNLKTYNDLIDELNQTRVQLEEANDIIEAIRSGEIDALIVKDKDGHQLYTLKNADQTYRIFIEQMTEGAVTLNEDGTILYCNSQFASLAQLPMEKVTGQSFCSFFTPEQQASCRELVLKAWNTSLKGELNMISHSGKTIPVLLSLKTLNLDEGLSMSIIVTDLSSQKENQQLLQQKNEQLEQARELAQQLNINLEQTVKERTKELEINIREKIKIEEALLRNQERLTRILETMAEGVGIIDTDGRFTYVNPMAKNILGLDHNEESATYYTTKWQHLTIDGTPLDKAEHPIAVMMRTRQAIYDFEIALQPPDGERFYISVNAAPLQDQKGTLIGGVVTFMDVTNRRKMIQQKDEFISVASHELKTPLTSLKASMQVLTRLITVNPGSEKVPDFVDKANKNLAKVLHLTEDLMNVSRLQHGQLPLNKIVFNLPDIIKDCCDHLRSGGTHELLVEGESSLQVYGDPQRIEQVIVNLVNNAIKYAPDSKKIKIRMEACDGMAKISVQDFGIGISSEKLPHLFDRYYRADATGIQFSGLGLGLYISAQIIERHGGGMGVESTLGQGSTFWLTLPLQQS